MNRSVLFGGIAAVALGLTLAAGAGAAIAAIADQALTAAASATAFPTSTSADRTEANAPSSPALTVTPSPSPTAYLGPQPLVGSTPSTSDAEIMAYAMSAAWASDDPQNAKVWGQEQILTVTCMAGKGWDYDPRITLAPFASRAPGEQPTLTWDPAAWLALSGNTGAGDAYRWQDAGCEGYAVHATGNDDNN